MSKRRLLIQRVGFRSKEDQTLVALPNRNGNKIRKVNVSIRNHYPQGSHRAQQIDIRQIRIHK